MFQALLSRELKDRGIEAEVESAGILGILAAVGAPANEKAIICMKERGLDITSHRSRRVSDLDLPSYDIVFCIALFKKTIQTLIDLMIPLDKIEFVTAGDPCGEDIETYRACAETLAREATRIAGNLARS